MTPSARRVYAVLTAPALLVNVMFVLLPLVCVGVYSFWSQSLTTGQIDHHFTLKNWYALISDPFYFTVLLRTAKLAALSTLIALIVGFAPAWYLTTLPPRRRAALTLLLLVPSWISYVVRTMSWMQLLGRNGPVNSFLVSTGLISAPLPLLYNDFSVYIGTVHYSLPVMIINIYLALMTLDRNLTAAARTLGANGFQTFVAVVVPLCKGGIIAGCLICFVWTIGAYITPLLLGGPGSTYYGMVVYDTILTDQDWPTGSALALLSVLFLTVCLIVYSRSIGLSKLFQGER